MAIATVTVTGHAEDAAQEDGSGHAEFMLSGLMLDPDGNTLVFPSRIIVPFDDDGNFSKELYATNDPATQPEGLTYRVTLRTSDGRHTTTRTWHIELDYQLGTVDLADLTPVDDTERVYSLVTAANITVDPDAFTVLAGARAQAVLEAIDAALAARPTTGALTELVQDIVGDMADDGVLVDFTYDDATGALTATVVGLTSSNVSDFAEAVRDRMGSTLTAGPNVTVTVDDTGDTVTIGLTGVATTEQLQAEADARGDADDALAAQIGTLVALADAIGDEATARANADGALDTRLDSIESREFFVSAYGGGPLVADNTDALNDAIAAAAAAGGGTVRWIGRLDWAGQVDVPDGVNLLGFGSGKATAASTLRATHADAQIAFGQTATGSRGGLSGNFLVDGNDLATQPLYIGRRVQSMFAPLYVVSAAGDGVVIEEAQNNYFAQLSVEDCAGAGVVFDLGCGGMLFDILEVNNCGSDGSGQVEFRMTAAPGLLMYAVPTDIHFTQAVIERPAVGCPANISHLAGQDITFDGPVLAAVTADAGFTQVKMTYDGSHSSQRLHIRGAYMIGDTAHVTVFHVANGCSLLLETRNVVQGAQYMWRIETGAEVEVAGLTRSNIGTLLHPSSTGGIDTVVRSRHRFPFELTRTATGDHAMIGVIEGEAGARFRILGDGSFQQGNGANFSYGVARADSSGSWKAINLALGLGVGATFAGGTGGIFALGDADTVPTTDPVEGGVVYSEGGILKWRSAAGVIYKLALSAADILALIATVDGAGTGLDADLLDGLSSSVFARAADIVTVRKTADQDFNNSTTLTDVTQLAFPGLAGETWVGEFELFTVGDATADMKLAITVPAGASIVYGLHGPRTADSVMQAAGASASGTAIPLGAGGTNLVTVRFSATFGATPGNVQLQAAQNVLTAAGTFIKAGSHGVARRA